MSFHLETRYYADRRDSYTPMVSQETILSMAQEKACTAEYLGELMCVMTDERQPCAYFGPITTESLVQDILLNANASDAQLAAAARELRLRLIAENQGLVDAEFSRLMAEA